MWAWLSGWLMHPALALGAAAVASPILIHILSRRRFRVVRWPTMEFLLAAHQRNRRRVRFEQLLLLVLRCLIVALLAMLVARPFLRPSAAAALIGSAPRTERIILLDDSYSTGYRPAAGQSVFSIASSAVQQMARWVAGEMPDDSLTVVLMSDPTKPLVALPNLSEEHLARLHESLAALSPSDRPARLTDGLGAISNLIEQAPTQSNAAIYVVSDMQRRDWLPDAATSAGSSAVAKAGSGASVLAPLTRLVERRRSVRLTLVDVGADHPANAALVELRPLLPQIIAGVRTRFEAAVANYSDQPLIDAELRVSIKDQALPPIVLPRIEPRQTTRQPIELIVPSEGHDRLVAELAAPGDLLALDDRRALGVEALPAVSVLLVDGEPNADNYLDEVFLLRTALNPAGRVSSGNDVRVVSDDQLETLELKPFHLVVLANVYRLSDAAARRIEEYVAGGGGLIVFLGDQVDAAAYNERLYAGGNGMLPAELGEVVAEPTGRGVGLGEWDEADPILRPFAGDAAKLLRMVRFNSYYSARLAAESTMLSETLDQSATGDATPRVVPTSMPASAPATTTGPGVEPRRAKTRPAARVLAALADADHSPLLIERSYGAGHVLMCTTSADLEWNGWGRDPSYVAVLLQAAQVLARPSSFVGQSAVSSPIRTLVDPNAFSTRGAVRLPKYPVDPPYEVEAKPADGGLALTWSGTQRAGVYAFDVKRLDGESQLRFVAVNPDPTEGDLEQATLPELRAALHEMPFEYVRDLKAFSGSSSDSRSELWWPVLLVVVALMMTEQGLARWFGARG